MEKQLFRPLCNIDKLKFELPSNCKLSLEEFMNYIYKKKIYDKVEYINWLEPAQHKQISYIITQPNQDIQ